MDLALLQLTLVKGIFCINLALILATSLAGYTCDFGVILKLFSTPQKRIHGFNAKTRPMISKPLKTNDLRRELVGARQIGRRRIKTARRHQKKQRQYNDALALRMQAVPALLTAALILAIGTHCEAAVALSLFSMSLGSLLFAMGFHCKTPIRCRLTSFAIFAGTFASYSFGWALVAGLMVSVSKPPFMPSTITEAEKNTAHLTTQAQTVENIIGFSSRSGRK